LHSHTTSALAPFVIAELAVGGGGCGEVPPPSKAPLPPKLPTGQSRFTNISIRFGVGEDKTTCVLLIGRPQVALTEHSIPRWGGGQEKLGSAGNALDMGIYTSPAPVSATPAHDAGFYSALIKLFNCTVPRAALSFGLFTLTVFIPDSQIQDSFRFVVQLTWPLPRGLHRQTSVPGVEGERRGPGGPSLLSLFFSAYCNSRVKCS